MRKLAAKLGVQVSSLYSHVKTKDDLLSEIGNQIMERRRRSRSAMRRLAYDDPARTPKQRKQDALNRLQYDTDAWVATADGGSGTPYLVPLSFL